MNQSNVPGITRTARIGTLPGYLMHQSFTHPAAVRQFDPTPLLVAMLIGGVIGFERELFSPNVQQVPRGTGTGFVWDERGHVVTNFHVIQEANAAQVTLADQSSFRAELVGAFADRDLAVLRIAAPRGKLVPLPLGSSRDLQVATIGRTLSGSRYRHVTIVASCIVSVAWCSSGTGCPFRRARL